MKSSVYEVLRKAKVSRSEVTAVGVGVPGPIDTRRGVVKNPPNLPGWENTPLLAILQEELKLPVVLENDANAAALGENFYGSGKGIKNFIYITLSTGIGGGIVTNGRLFKGESGNAGEIGHMTINFDGPRCGCGSFGCWEAYASGKALARFAWEGIVSGRQSEILNLAAKQDVKAEHVFAAAKKGDEFALELIDKEAFYLGVGLANVINVYNPKRIALGGGLTNEWDMFYEPMMRVMKSRALRVNAEKLEVVRATLASDVGILGAAAIAWPASVHKPALI